MFESVALGLAVSSPLCFSSSYKPVGDRNLEEASFGGCGRRHGDSGRARRLGIGDHLSGGWKEAGYEVL